MTLAGWWVHTVTVATFLGNDQNGPLYSAPVTVPCFVDNTTKLVPSAAGEQVVAQTTLYADCSYAALFTTDSQVTFGTRPSRVLTINNYTAPGLGLPECVEVTLQ